jgi:hypothetical protein
MQLKKSFLLFSYLNLFSIGILSNAFYKHSAARNKEAPVMIKGFCEIDNYYDSLVKSKASDILLYKEFNTPAGNKGLVIWREKNCVYGFKFMENVLGDGCKKEEVNSDNQKLWLIAVKFFLSGEQNYTVEKSKIEAMHDFKIEIRALVNGKAMQSEFFDSSTGNKSELLPEISRLCQGILYNW